jgi:hypothetical protein
MRECWARCLGDCSASLSKEHTVTAALFDTDVVNVQGLDWCKNEPKAIGLANATRKILCEAHNSRLSPVDSAAVEAFNVFRESVRLTSVREKMKERHWLVSRMVIDGSALERWFLKTLINVTVGGDKKIGPKSLMAGEPSADLVEIAYSLRQFVPNGGLYYAAEVGDIITSEDRVTIIPFFDAANEHIFGGRFHFRGFQFILYLGEEGFTDRLSFLNRNSNTRAEYPRPSRHLAAIKVIVGPSRKCTSHIIEIKWQ